MSQFAVVKAETREILYGFGLPDPADYTGPLGWQPFPHDGLIYFPWQGALELGSAPSPAHKYLWIEDRPQWVIVGDLTVQRAIRSDEISAACRAQIEKGFICAALGTLCLYPAKAQDQANLVASVTDSLLFADDPDWTTPFWCADDQGAWDFRLHTRAQIQQVGRQGKASILAAMQRNEVLQRQIATATEEQLRAIVW